MRRKNFMSFLKGLLLIQLFLLSVAAGLTFDFNTSFPGMLNRLKMLHVSMPFSQGGVSQRQADLLFLEAYIPFIDEDSWLSLGLNQIKSDRIAEDMIDAHMQVLAYAAAEPEPEQTPAQVPPEQEETKTEPEPTAEADWFKGQVVFMYCTHSAESYVPNGGKARVDGKRGLINQVAATLQQSISDQGLQAEFIDKIHDYPDYDQSYANSRVTVKQILQDNHGVAALFDVHRDSIPGTTKAATVSVAGRDSARILIVVGTDERKPHPNWKKNLAFAQALYDESEKMYPGLIKGVITKAGTYNQEFHTHALLLEFGSDYNTLEEAEYAAQLFADVLTQVLKEEATRQ